MCCFASLDFFYQEEMSRSSEMEQSDISDERVFIRKINLLLFQKVIKSEQFIFW